MGCSQGDEGFLWWEFWPIEETTTDNFFGLQGKQKTKNGYLFENSTVWFEVYFLEEPWSLQLRSSNKKPWLLRYLQEKRVEK